MEQCEKKKEAHVHVLIFPLPSQGHINSMLRLARLLCRANFRVTFLNFDYNHQRLLDTHIVSQAAQWPGFQFDTISDGLPPHHPRSPATMLTEVFPFYHTHTKPLFKEMLISYRRSQCPLTCVIADGIMSTFTTDAADKVGIPIIAFRTASACSFWSLFNIPQLIEGGEIPFTDADMDAAVTCVRGMESIIRRRDLPSFCRTKQVTDPTLQVVSTETLSTARASALILNTLEEMEGPILSQIRTTHPNTYAIGPLHALLKCRLTESSESTTLHDSLTSASLWKEDRSCIPWLDSQPPNSVLYVSFGSITVVNRSQMLEFWHGLVNSRTRFLWVIRPDLVDGRSEEGKIPEELQKATRERGFLAEWVPQEEVLGHPAVGGFLTHSGWNSTLESVVAGVPMLCWPFFGDQQVNSRYVEHEWRIGLDMKDACERGMIERMIGEVMHANVEIRKSAVHLADLTKKSVSSGGSSYRNFERLIRDIRTIRP